MRKKDHVKRGHNGLSLLKTMNDCMKIMEPYCTCTDKKNTCTAIHCITVTRESIRLNVELGRGQSVKIKSQGSMKIKEN